MGLQTAQTTLLLLVHAVHLLTVEETDLIHHHQGELLHVQVAELVVEDVLATEATEEGLLQLDLLMLKEALKKTISTRSFL